MEARPAYVDAYLANAPDDARARFGELRQVVLGLAPNATETMSYGMLTTAPNR